MLGPDLKGERSEAEFVYGTTSLTSLRMDQIVNTLCLYTVENGLLTRCASIFDDSEPAF
jgi:hypothetical protein